jgi:CheY-like chemotaxis protein
VAPGAYVRLDVADTGTGMDTETQSRIFEPFFTTKEQGKGTGLGLSTVYGIVKQSDGYIEVQTEIGKGTKFSIYLPRVEEAAQASAPAAAPVRQLTGTETILLVEDEDGVRSLARQLLQRQGYTVLDTRHGGEALLACERHAGQIHLLLTDVILAQMSGRELAQRLARRRPEMKVLYMSGYSGDAVAQQGIADLGSAFLQKPFSTESLISKVREVLDTPRADAAAQYSAFSNQHSAFGKARTRPRRILTWRELSLPLDAFYIVPGI